MSAVARPLPRIAWGLGYGGVIPFVVLSLVAALKLDLSAFGIADVTGALLGYGAVIISFIGAVHWGVALGADHSGNRTSLFIYSVLPALAAWCLLLCPPGFALAGMALTVVIAYLVDRSLLFSKVPTDYGTLRLHLTAIVTLSLLLAALFV